MTKKDYIKFAAMFKKNIEHDSNVNSLESMRTRQLILESAVIFHSDNPNFRPYQYFEACGLDKETAYNFATRI